MKIRPLHDRVVVRRAEEETTSAGGIVIPGSANQEKPIRGHVIAIGTGKVLDNGQLRALVVKVGDEVVFGKYAGTEIKMGADDFVVMPETDILAVIEK